MRTTLYKELFNFDIEKIKKISISENEVYNQFLLYAFSHKERDLVILTQNLNDSNKLFFKIKNYLDDVYIFPDDDYLTKKAIAVSPDLLYMRMNLLNNISDAKPKIVICHLNSFLKKLPNYKEFKNLNIILSEKDKIKRNDLIEKLSKIGYKRDSVVTNTGEFSVRGFVVDIFPFNEDHPIRIEFFDDEIEKIKYFDESTQLSIKSVTNIKIKPILDEYSNSNSSIMDYLNDPLLVIQDESKIISAFKALKEQVMYYGQNDISNLDFKKYENKIFVDLLDKNEGHDLNITAQDIGIYNEKSEVFIEDIIKNNGVLFSVNKNFNDSIKTKKIKIIEEPLFKGFIYNGNYYYSINDLRKPVEAFNYNIRYKVGQRVTGVDNLKIGDYIVHKTHGIGIYMGVCTITKGGLEKDYILLQYKGTDKLYISVDSLEKLYKYSSRDGARPNIQKLNSGEWDKIKARIKNRVKEVAQELIKIYKERAKTSVIPYDQDYDVQKQFESEFEYEETADQLRAINEIKRDLESSKPMDRLLCGDVGYGKTEVIFRAIFKTVLNDKQVIYLCPTTLLSHQQYESAKKRFQNYGVNMALLNRHISQSKAKEILKDFENGRIDVIFGTHRLLSEDVKPNKLGLLVVDEEQRFGVVHKEKMKKYKTNVHVLSVSATPIPRSLQMSLTGVRDLSLIETPPKNRYPVQTYVIEYNEMLVREAIIKEVSRGGQVFVLYNKIKNMDDLIKKYEALIPEVSIRYAHGQMERDDMQDIMNDFYENKFNVLISTTIIENGIDIPNANTILVVEANLFGLSQLYQIRGRVGRSDKIAYAYLMYKSAGNLTDGASQRLNAIKEFTELGSGYKIAMRDLSIRGAGDMLGTEQAGFIDAVGVDLYLELINEELNNKDEDAEDKATILDEVDTHISEKYTDEDELIIELHNKINSVNSDEKFDLIRSEIIDRFGVIDPKIELYMAQEYTEKLFSKLNISILINDKTKISFKLQDSIYNKLSIEELFVKANQINTKFNFAYRNNYIMISFQKLNYEKNYLYYLLDLLKYINKKAGD